MGLPDGLAGLIIIHGLEEKPGSTWYEILLEFGYGNWPLDFKSIDLVKQGLEAWKDYIIEDKGYYYLQPGIYEWFADVRTEPFDNIVREYDVRSSVIYVNYELI
jgi:hypothetical protein